MEFVLNGRPTTATPQEGESLLAMLRDRCGITSAKDGCAPEGSCGACTVHVDGRAVVSCAQPAARAAGRSVVTAEGLPPDRRDHWADAFTVAGASQCGYCSPGLIMKAEAFLDRHPDPSRDEVATALAGNLCRCTGYVKVIDAVLLAAGARRGEAIPPVDTSGRVGSRTARTDARALALGDRAFVADLTMPGMLHAAIRFADHPRAVVLGIDSTPARAAEGVVSVLTAADVPGDRFQGEITPDWPQLVAVGETTRYVGDVLAVVAARTRAEARAAAALIEVEYDVLAPVVDVEAAVSPDAPQLHPHAPGNVLSTSVVSRGDIDAALAAAAHVVTDTFTTQRIEHAFLEPESCLAHPTDDGGIHVFTQGQGIWSDRRQIAGLLGLPLDQVSATLLGSGGGFGGKEDLNIQGHAALLTQATGQPVRLVLSREESLRFHVKRHPLSMTFTIGCDAAGRLLGLRARIVGDTGAYASVGKAVLERAAGHATGVYRFDAVDVVARAVYTNNVPCGAMRGFGVNQVTFALEGLLDRLAAAVGIDRWQIRWDNALDVGDTFGTGQVLGPGVGIRPTLLAVRDAFREARYAGIGCAVKNTGIGNGLVDSARVVLRPEPDGSVTLFNCWTEMGQGVNTVLAQILCEELDITPERVRVVTDTSHELGVGQTTASRGTTLGGRAVIDAAEGLRAALGDSGAAGLPDLAGREFPGEVVIDWTTPNSVPPDERITHLAFGWATQVVVLDDDGRLARVIAAHDVGRAINPTLLEGQIEGAVHMGLGFALSEEYVVADARPVTTTLKSQHIIPPSGMPPVEVILVEVHQPEGPYGAKGVGEIGLVPTAAAVAGALHAFDGRHRTSLPMTDSAAARAAVPRLARNR